MGVACGTEKSGVGVASMGGMRPELVMKSTVPVVMSGVLGFYGLIIAVIIITGINRMPSPVTSSMATLTFPPLSLVVSLLVWLLELSAMLASAVRANPHCTAAKAFFGMILILIFVEALALYGLIVGTSSLPELVNPEQSRRPVNV